MRTEAPQWERGEQPLLSSALLLSLEKPWWLKHFFLHLFVFLDFLPIWGQLILVRNKCLLLFPLCVYLGEKKSIAVFNIIKSICSWELPCSDTRTVSYPQTCSHLFSCQSPWHL